MDKITIKPVEIQISPYIENVLTFAQEYKESLMREMLEEGNRLMREEDRLSKISKSPKK